MADANLQVVALAPANPEATAALAAQQAAEEKEYQRLKAELQTWCQGTALTCFVATVIFYSKVNCWSAVGVVEAVSGFSMTHICLSFYSGCTPMQSHGATVWRGHMAFLTDSYEGQSKCLHVLLVSQSLKLLMAGCSLTAQAYAA